MTVSDRRGLSEIVMVSRLYTSHIQEETLHKS